MVALQFLVLSVVVRIRLGQHIANNPSSLYDLKGYFVLSSECLWRIVRWIDEEDRFGFSAILSSIMSLCSPLSAWFGWGGGCSARLFCAIAGSWETKSRISYVVFSLEDSQKQKSFLYAAVRNACIDKLRRKNPIVQDISPSDLSGIISDEQAVDSSSREAELWTAIEQLPERCREIFLMSKRDGMTYREIAEELCLSEKTVEHQISKALKTLRGKKGDFFFLLPFVLG